MGFILKRIITIFRFFFFFLDCLPYCLIRALGSCRVHLAYKKLSKSGKSIHCGRLSHASYALRLKCGFNLIQFGSVDTVRVRGGSEGVHDGSVGNWRKSSFSEEVGENRGVFIHMSFALVLQRKFMKFFFRESFVHCAPLKKGEKRRCRWTVEQSLSRTAPWLTKLRSGSLRIYYWGIARKIS